jgi:hypothetical protein
LCGGAAREEEDDLDEGGKVFGDGSVAIAAPSEFYLSDFIGQFRVFFEDILQVI